MFRNILDLVVPVLFFYHWISMGFYFKDHLSEEAAKKYRTRIDIPTIVILAVYNMLAIIDWIFLYGIRINLIINNAMQWYI